MVGQRRRRLASLFAAAAVTAVVVPVVGASSAEAYTYTGCRWASGRVTLRNTSSANYSGATDAAMNAWNGGTKSGVYFAKVGGAANVVTDDYNLGNVGFDGGTYNATSCPGGYLDNNGTQVVSRYNTFYTGGYNVSQRTSVMAHELGHVYGLNHSDDGAVPPCAQTKLMFRSSDHRTIECAIYGPRTDDLNGVNARY